MLKAKLISLLATLAASLSYASTTVSAAPIEEVTRNSAVIEACYRVRDLAPPSQDLPNSTQIKAMTQCNAIKLYDEAHESQPVSSALMSDARYCAFAQKDHGVLAMLYANGYGVAKNLDLAIKFACEGSDDAGGFSMDQEFVVQELLDIQDGTAALRMQEACSSGAAKCSKNDAQSYLLFDICDTAFRPVFAGWCSVRSESTKEAKRTRALDEAARSMTAAQASSFRDLRNAAAILAEDRAYEVDTSGSDRASSATTAIATQRDLFLTELINCEHGNLPKASPGGAKGADRALNDVYKIVMQTKSSIDLPDSIGESNVARSDVRKAERDWVRYRDAWLAFAKLRYPKASVEALQAMLTDERRAQLQSLLNEWVP